ncbi:zinc-finger-containing protein [Halomonas sp. Bachu 37]|uniref:zinc-finger-containing protein n=1 Tax=Halomonas kashgarensis TaxID=3084920 RepID=UPI00321802B7
MSDITPQSPCPRAISRVTDPLPPPVVCPHCQSPVDVASHREVYGQDYGSWPWFYLCTGCEARVGIHPKTDIPLGTLVTDAIREARKHSKARFTPLYETGRMTRREAYQALADRLGIPVSECHFGWFDSEMCEKAGKVARELYIAYFNPAPDPVARTPV